MLLPKPFIKFFTMKIIIGADQSLSLYILEENVSWTFVIELWWNGANN